MWEVTRPGCRMRDLLGEDASLRALPRRARASTRMTQHRTVFHRSLMSGEDKDGLKARRRTDYPFFLAYRTRWSVHPPTQMMVY